MREPSNTEYTPKRRLAGQVSIKGTVAEAAVEAAPAAPLETDSGTGMPASSKEVNPALLLKVWRDYALKLKQSGRDSLHATLSAREPRPDGPGRVVFNIVNAVQENYMRAEKPELLGYLRRQLGDPAIDLQILVEAPSETSRPVTPLAKFKVLAEKNPALLKLREELDLDLG